MSRMVNKGMPQRMQIDPIELRGTLPPDEPPNLGVYPMAPPPARAGAATEDVPPPAPEAPQSPPPSSMSILQDPAFLSFVQRRANDLKNAQVDAEGRQKWANLANGFQRARAWGNSVAPDQASIDQKNAYAQKPVTDLHAQQAAESGAIKDVDVASQASERGIKGSQLQASLDPNSPLSRNSYRLAVAQGMIPPSYPASQFSAAMLQEMEKGATLDVARKHAEAQVKIAGAQLAEHHAANEETARHHKAEEAFMYQKPLPPQSVTELESLLSGVKAVDALKAQKGSSSFADKLLSKLPGDLGDFAQTKNATAGAIAAAEAKGRMNPSGAIKEKQLLSGAFQDNTGLDTKRKQLLDQAEQRLNVLAAGGARPAEVAEYRAQLDALKGTAAKAAPAAAPAAAGSRPRRTVNGETREWDGKAWVPIG